jgi:hypothetical protein
MAPSVGERKSQSGILNAAASVGDPLLRLTENPRVRFE